MARAIAARARAVELGSALTGDIERMIAHVVATHRDALAGTELDPAQVRAKRSKLIARAEELLPKQAAGGGGGSADVASQLKAAMRGNAFSGLRFSGRDPVEVVDELRASWREVGPIDTSDADDRALAERFDDVLDRALAASGVSRDQRGQADAAVDRGGTGGAGDRNDTRRRRRDRHGAQQPIAPDGPHAEHAALTAAAVATVADAEPVAPPASGIPQAAHDAITQPARLPTDVPASVEPSPAPPAPSTAPEPASTSSRVASPSTHLPEPPVRKTTPTVPPMDALDTGWDLGDEDPTAGTEPAKTAPETSTPSSAEMAGDGAVEGDGIDTGWD